MARSLNRRSLDTSYTGAGLYLRLKRDKVYTNKRAILKVKSLRSYRAVKSGLNGTPLSTIVLSIPDNGRPLEHRL